MNNTRFEPGCDLPGLVSLTAGLYATSVSSAGSVSAPVMALTFTFDSAFTRRKFTCVRIESAGEGFLARLMPVRLDCYTQRNAKAASVLSDYNHTDYRAIAIRGQQWLGLVEESSNSNENTVVISSISEMVDGDMGEEMHVYFTIENTRNIMTVPDNSLDASTPEPVTVPEPIVEAQPAVKMMINVLDDPAIVDAKVAACVRSGIAFDFVS